jgi:hypothetical protein
MNRFLIQRILLILGLLAIIGGAIYMAGVNTKDAPNHQVADDHDHDGDGKPDHAPGAH